MKYTVSAADRRPLPAAYRSEHRHLGLIGDEAARPFAHYFTPTARPIQESARDAAIAGAMPHEFGYEIDEVADHLSKPGHEVMESGWTQTEKGTLMVACHTDMPGVTAEMWDWWFGWHGTDTARYKLWNPVAHQFSAVGEDRSADRSLTYRQRYVNNVSYVDEYIGHAYGQLAIRFLEAEKVGFDSLSGTTHICARVGLSNLPVASGWLVHQVRPTEGGSEMRSRFFLGHPEILAVPPAAVSSPAAGRTLRSPAGAALKPVIAKAMQRNFTLEFGGMLMHHCAQEMNHLAGFLPNLFDEFKDLP